MGFFTLGLKNLKRITTLSIIGMIIVSSSIIVIFGFNVDHRVTDESNEEIKKEKHHSKDTPFSYNSVSDRSLIHIVDDGEDVGEHTSIDRSNEEIYISYYSKSEESLKLARSDPLTPDNWYVWTVDDEGDVGEYSSIDVIEEKVHVAYYDSSNRNLKYLVWSEDGVHKSEVIDDAGDVGKYVSLEVGKETAHVSYYHASNSQLRCAVREDDEWEVTSFHHDADVGQYTSIALDGEGYPHIVYYDWTRRDLRYTWKNGNGWEHDSIGGSSMHVGRHASLALDDKGIAHIACHEWTDENYRLMYVTNEKGELKSNVVDEETPFVGTHTSIAMDKDGNGTSHPVISYHQWDEENLKLAWKEEGKESWSVETIDTDHRVGRHTSLVMKRKGEAHVSYYDKGERNLKHARVFTKERTPLAPSNFNTSSEYGDILLDWDSPIYDGIPDGNNSILGYNLYRKNEICGEAEFKILEEGLPGHSYRDNIPTENESDIYIYKVAAVNERGVGDNSTEIKTRGRYFTYDRVSSKKNLYEISEDMLPEKADILRFDPEYDVEKAPNWEREIYLGMGDKEVGYEHFDAGLKSVLLEIEFEDETVRHCLQSAWVFGEFDLTSSYEEHGSKERFFYLPENRDNNGEWDHLGSVDSLRNTYMLETPEELPYDSVDFDFLEINSSVSDPEQKENDIEVWKKTLNVSASREDTSVKAIPYLYNKHRDEIENPLAPPHEIDLKEENEKEVEIVDTPDWFPYLLDAFFGDNLEINNKEKDGEYIGWVVEFEVPELDDVGYLQKELDPIDISGTPELEILNDLERYFGGDYGFKMELFPDGDIVFDNNLNFETTLVEFQTDIDEDEMGIDSFEGKLGNSYDYAASPELEVSAGVRVDLLIKEEGISVSGELELDVGAGIQIDIPLKSIGIAEVGLTAEIGGGIGVDYQIGSLDYDKDSGLSLDPGNGEVPIEFLLNFGGGPYGDVASGLARVEGKLVLEVIMDLELPSKDTGLNYAGRFEVEASAGWGLWSKTRSWDLYSTDDDSLSMISPDTNSAVENQFISTDRLATKYYGTNKDISRTRFGQFGQKRNVGPRVDPQIVSLNESSALAVWSELSKGEERGFQSNLYMQEFSKGRWKDKELVPTDENMTYDSRLVRLNEEDKVALIYLGMTEKLTAPDSKEELERYYANNTLRGKLWCPSEGWSDLNLNHSVEAQAICSYDVGVDDQDSLQIVYRSGQPSLDIFDSSISQEGNIRLLKHTREDWDKINISRQSEHLPRSSRPSIEFVDGEWGVVYTRIISDDEGKYDQSYYNRTVFVPMERENEPVVRETPNTTSNQILSKEDDRFVVTWVENHTHVRRKVLSDGGRDIPDKFTSVYSGKMISGLDHHENALDAFYTFQGGRDAQPMIIESVDDGWGKLRGIPNDISYAPGQIDHDFGLEVPKLISVEKEETIDSWHVLHYNFDGSFTHGEVHDKSGEENTGKLKGEWGRANHGDKIERNGNYIKFLDGNMSVDHSSSMNVTDDAEDFSITAVLKVKSGEEGYLMKKESSWAVLLNDDNELDIELWEENKKHSLPISRDFPSSWTFFALRYEENRLDVTLKALEKPGGLDEFTETIYLDDFGSLSSRDESLVLASYPNSVFLDDFRLVERYLPDASLEKINVTSYPHFDSEYTITTEKAPLFVNFTHSNPVVGKPIDFEGWSPNSGLNWTWTFENGKRRYGRWIQHNFDETGFHTVLLETEHNTTGSRSNYEKTLHVIDVDPPRFDGIEEHYQYDKNNSVRVEWREAKGESEPFEYRIHHKMTVVDKDKSVRFDHSSWSKSTSNNFTTLEDLDPTFQHHVKISVRNSVGLVNTSASPIYFRLQDNLPPKFRGIELARVVDSEEKRVKLSWDEAEDPSEPITYNVYHSRKENMSFKEPIKEIERETEVFIKVSDLGRHYFAVRAEDNVGNEEDNEIIEEVEVKDERSPFIKILNPREGAFLSSSITIRWESSDEQFGISRHQVKGDHQKAWSTLDKNTTDYTFNTLPEKYLTLKVRVVNNAGDFAGDSVNVTVVPKRPLQIDLISPADGAENLSTDIVLKVEVKSWEKETFAVEFFDSTGEEPSRLKRFEGVESSEELSYEWSSLAVNFTYRWFVKVIFDEGEVIRETWSFSTRSNSNAPIEPKNPRPEDGKEDVSLSPTLSVDVDHPHDEDLGVIFYNDSGEKIGEEEGVRSARRVAINWTGLEENTTYHWHVVVDDGKVKTRSCTWSFSTIETSSMIEVNNLQAEPIYGESPLVISVVGELENHGSKKGELTLWIRDEASEEIKSWSYSIDPYEVKKIEESHDFDEPGLYTVDLGDEEEMVRVVEEGDMDLQPHILDVPGEVLLGETETIRAVVENLQRDEEDVYMYVENEEVHRETIQGYENKTFEIDHLFDEVGDVLVEIRDEEQHAILRERVSVLESRSIEVTAFDLEPIYGEAPLIVSIVGEIENHGSKEREFTLWIRDEASEEIKSWSYSIDPYEVKKIEESHDFDELGLYTVDLGDEEEMVRVVEEGDMDLQPHILDVPEEVLLGETETIRAVVENLQEDEEDVYMYVENEEVHRETIRGYENRTFEIDHLFDEVGDVLVEIRDEEQHAILRERVRVLESRSIELTAFDLEPIYGEAPLMVSIVGEIENHGSKERELTLWIRDEASKEIKSWSYSLDPYELKKIEESHDFDEPGLYTVNLGNEEEVVRVMEEGDMDLQPHILDVPEEVLLGETETIRAVVENLQEDEEDVYMYVENEEVHRETIQGYENKTFEIDHLFDEVGDVVVEIRDEEQHAILRERVRVLDLTKEKLPDEPVNPRPYNGSEGVSISPTLNVDVTHPDNSTMNVYFYQKDSDEKTMIGVDQGVISGGTASLNWSGLKESTSYYWYVIVEAGDNKTISERWSFTTSESGMNNPPDSPSLIGPKHGSIFSKSSVTLEVEIIDKDGDFLNLTFYDVKNDRQIAPTHTNIPTNSTVEVEWTDLSSGEKYEWNVVVEDGEDTVVSPTWIFTIREEGVDSLDDEDEESSVAITENILVLILVTIIVLGAGMWYKEKFSKE